MREKLQQTLAEVSGAVEIDSAILADIERGTKRPSEDILMLLMSHFAVKEPDAVKLWELAGYDSKDKSDNPILDAGHQHVMVMPMDVRIVYTDMAHVTTNKYGVMVNFMQSVGLGNQPLAVSRVGMSHEHAEKLLELLQKALQKPTPKLLPAPKPEAEADTDVAK